MVRINEFENDEPKILELCNDEYEQLMVMAAGKYSSCIGDTGYDQERGCYVFAGFDIKRTQEVVA